MERGMDRAHTPPNAYSARPPPFSYPHKFICKFCFHYSMRIKWGLLLIAVAIFAVASVSAQHNTPTHNTYNYHTHNHYHTHNYNYQHTSHSPYWYDDRRHVNVYRHHTTSYFVPAPRGYPHVQHKRTGTVYYTYTTPPRNKRHCYRSGTRWHCRR